MAQVGHRMESLVLITPWRCCHPQGDAAQEDRRWLPAQAVDPGNGEQASGSSEPTWPTSGPAFLESGTLATTGEKRRPGEA